MRRRRIAGIPRSSGPLWRAAALALATLLLASGCEAGPLGNSAARSVAFLEVALPWLGPFRSEWGLSKGKFLVASRRLRDPNFLETVVLLLDYDAHGALGLIINRPTKLKLAKMLPELGSLRKRSDTVYIGGPVGRDQMLLLIRSPEPIEAARHVFADVYMSGSRTALERIAKQASSGRPFRVYAGRSGWAPGQLDREVARGDWHVLRGEARIVFDVPPDQIWPELISQGEGRVADVPQPPRLAGR